MTIGERIKAARETAGMTQVELGEKVGVSGVAIMRYEKGQRQPRYDQLQRIAKALDVSVHTLVDWDAVDKEEFKELFIYGEAPNSDFAEGQTGRPACFNKKSISTRARDDRQKVLQEFVKKYNELRSEGAFIDMGSFTLDLPRIPQRRIATALGKLNEEGQQIAAERVEELTEIPRYQAPRMLQSEKHVYGPYEAYTVVCPICGQTLTADERMGEAYCQNCKRPFPFTTIPEYQAQEPPTEAPQSPPATQKGTDTTPPPDAPTGASKDE